nr:MAG TPA: hypothetical protein [Caudoviricetes sp.]
MFIFFFLCSIFFRGLCTSRVSVTPCIWFYKRFNVSIKYLSTI